MQKTSRFRFLAMNTPTRLLTTATLLALPLFAPALAQTAADRPSAGRSSDLSDLARGHEQVFKNLSPGNTTAVLQKGDKQFTIYGVTEVRAIGSVVEITVKNGEKYSVGAGDIFFITNNAFKI